jgi:hypothetical protein
VPLSSARQSKESEKGLFNTNKQKTNTTTEIIYVNKAGHVYINFHTGLGGKHTHLFVLLNKFTYTNIIKQLTKLYHIITSCEHDYSVQLQ